MKVPHFSFAALHFHSTLHPSSSSPSPLSDRSLSLLVAWRFQILMASNFASDQQLVNTLPSHSCRNKFLENGITIPMHTHDFTVKFDNVKKLGEVDLSNSVAFQVGLSLVEILLQREEMVHWLKDHFYPAHHKAFHEEKVSFSRKHRSTINHENSIR